MVKTPQRRTKEENGDAPETPQEESLISPPASRLRSRPSKRRREEDDDDEDSVTTNEEGETTTTKPTTTKRRSTRARKKSGASDEEESVVTTDDEQRPAKKRKTSSTKRAGRKKAATKSSDDESMTEESVMASEDDDDDNVSMEHDAKPTAKQNGYKPAPSLPTVPEEEDTRTTNGTRALAPISKLRMPSKHTPGKLQTTAPAPGRTDKSRRFEFAAPTICPHASTTDSGRY